MHLNVSPEPGEVSFGEDNDLTKFHYLMKWSNNCFGIVKYYYKVST